MFSAVGIRNSAPNKKRPDPRPCAALGLGPKRAKTISQQNRNDFYVGITTIQEIDMYSETSERHKTMLFVTTVLANVRGCTYVRWKLIDAGQQCKPALAVLLT